MKMTLKEFETRYTELAEKLADAVNEIADCASTARFLSEQSKDNGDPAFLLDESLSKLANALAMTISYAKDYRNDVEKYGEDADVSVTQA